MQLSKSLKWLQFHKNICTLTRHVHRFQIQLGKCRAELQQRSSWCYQTAQEHSWKKHEHNVTQLTA